MKPVKQTKSGGYDVPPEERGDCWSACLATILEVEIAEVDVAHSDDPEWHWWDATREVLHGHGYVPVIADTHVWPSSFWIARVPSLNIPKGPEGQVTFHVIVMFDNVVMWDPSNHETYMTGTDISALDVQQAIVLVEICPKSKLQSYRQEGMAWRVPEEC